MNGDLCHLAEAVKTPPEGKDPALFLAILRKHFALQLFSAIEFMHSKGFVHLDIKPAVSVKFNWTRIY